MNKLIEDLKGEALDIYMKHTWSTMDYHDVNVFSEKFAELIVYDFLSELTNDDSLGEARIATIKRLAEKWGVAK